MRNHRLFKGDRGNFNYIDWGGSGPLAHFSHATGLCASIYSPIADCLIEDLHLVGMDDRGHGKTEAPADSGQLHGWNIFARDLECFLDSWKTPVIAMGHSRGAVSSLLLAIKRPDIVKALVLVDPTILPLSQMWFVYLAKRTGFIRYIPIAARAAKRRAVWPDRQTIYDVYRKKSMFQKWDPDCLEAYIEDGTEENGNGQIRLSCTPSWESRCFSVYPHDLWRHIPRVRQPMLVIYGGQSDTFRGQAAKRLKKKVPHASFCRFENSSHFVPMEKPVETADTILDFCRSL